MALKNRLIEVIYALKDKFTGQVGRITGAYGRIEATAKRSADQVEQANKRASLSFGGIGRAAAGLFTGGLFTAATVKLKAYVDEIDNLAKTARKLGTTTDELSKLGYAAELTGVKTTQLNLGLQRMTRRIAEAAQGSGAAKDAIKELGLDAQQLARLPLAEQFKTIADAFENVRSESDRVRLGFKLFDSEGVALINTMEGGRASLEAYGDELERLGGVIRQEAAESAEQLNDALTRFNTNVDAFTNRYGPGFIRTLNEAFDFYGFGARNLDAVLQDIADLKTRRDELAAGATGLFDVLFGPTQDERLGEIQKIDAQLEALAKERARFINSEYEKRSRADKQREEKASAATSKQTAKQETDALRAELTQREQLYRAHTRELEQIRAQSRAAESEFTGLADELASDATPATAPDLRAVQDIRARAGQQLAAGEFDAAVESARKAGELLKQIKENGGESNIVLAGTAQLLRQLAEEAARGKEQAKILDVEASKKGVEELKTEIEAAKKQAESNTVKIKLQVDAGDFQKQVAAAVAEAQASAGPVIVRPTPTVFTDGTAYGFGDEVETEVLKRG